MLTLEAAFRLAAEHQNSGRLSEAEALYQRILQVAPGHADSLNNLGILWATQERLNEAVAAFRRAIQSRPDYADAHNNLGGVLKKQHALDEAAAAFSQALEWQPGHAEAWSNLGTVLAEQGHVDEAIAAHRRALQLEPDYPQCYNNLAVALAENGDFHDAATAYHHALTLQPDYAEAKFNYSLLLLLLGDFERGWPLYEARWNQPGFAPRPFSQPLWEGGSVEGQRILLHAEQGFGDSIQLIRYAPLLAERGGHVIVECPRPLVDLFRGAKSVRQIIVTGDPLPPFDVHAPMHSLPWLFQTTAETIPAEVPYLIADPNRCRGWEVLLGSERPCLRVGVALSGNPYNRWTRKRDIPAELFRPILQVPGINFFSLQVSSIESLPPSPGGPAAIHDSASALQDFADTAALMVNLDLIITAETAVAHLAGALGRPTWTLVPFVPAWRWGLGRTDSPWYPTMRLFRQPALGDWSSVIHQVAEELERLSAAVQSRSEYGR